MRTIAIRALIIFALLIIILIGYAPGLSGSLFYDDYSNLSPLAEINTQKSAWDFVFSWYGPKLQGTGRPLAFASFLLQADAWPQNSSSLLRINVAIHLCNASLLFVIAYLILRLRKEQQEYKDFYVSLSAAFLWAVLPLLASTSLIAIQRMTGLAALFGLFGLLIFVYGYYIKPPRRALIVQLVGLGVGTSLAMLSKETGALIPVFALVIDRVLIKETIRNQSSYSFIRTLLLILAFLFLIIYLSPFRLDWFEFNLNRQWTPFERLQTQGVILWRYLAWAFFPRPSLFGPFHDDTQLVQSVLYTSFAWFGFLAALVFSWLAWKKYNFPWLLFVFLWFLTGHLLESTVLPLELVFEHRNYLAVFGFCFALSYVAWHLPPHLRRIGLALLSAYALQLWLILYATTSIWGDQLAAAENWVQNHPKSSRAALHMAYKYFDVLGNSSYLIGKLDLAVTNCPECLDVQIQALLYACRQENESQIKQRFSKLLIDAYDGNLSSSFIDGLYPLKELIDQDKCEPLTYKKIRALISVLLDNPAYVFWEYQVHLRYHAAEFAFADGEPQNALDQLEKAESIGPDVMPILQLQVGILVEENRYDDALAAIERRRHLDHYRLLGMNPKALDELANNVNGVRQSNDSR